MAELYVGIDGGGTHARAVVLDSAGAEVARHSGAAGLVDPRDPAAAARSVADLAREALALAGAGDAAALCCGLAGAGRRQEREAVRRALLLECVATDVRVIGDAEAAMADAFPGGGGVLVVAGTGSIAWARSPGGAPVRVGGWGQLLGDDGSAYALALGALRTVVRAADTGATTLLTAAVLARTGLTHVEDLVPWSAASTKGEIAALAPEVIRCARSGDEEAAAIRAAAVRDIAALAVTAARRIENPAPAIALAGALVQPGGPLRSEVEAEVMRQLPDARFLHRLVDAALGAARLARGEA